MTTYNDIYDAIESIGRRERWDTNETAFLLRELEYIKSQTYDVLYAANMARQILPVSHDVSPGAQTWSYDVWDWRGAAKIVADYADDFPRVDVSKAKVQAQVKTVGASYGWSIKDMDSARMTNTPLDVRRALACRNAVENAIDEIASLGTLDGIAVPGMVGFCNNAAITPDSLPNGGWAAGTAVDMAQDIISFVRLVGVNTKEIFQADTLLLPPTLYTEILRPFGDVAAKSVKTVVEETFPGLRILSWPRLETAAAGNTPRIIAFAASPMVVSLEIPLEYQERPPQEKGMDFSIPARAEVGGVAFMYPAAVRYADNAD